MRISNAYFSILKHERTKYEHKVPDGSDSNQRNGISSESKLKLTELKLKLAP